MYVFTGAGWYVSKVVIRECEPSDVDYIRTFTFGCDRWFDTSMEDGKIERVLIGGLELPVQEEREEEVEEEIEEESEKEEEEEEEQIPKGVFERMGGGDYLELIYAMTETWEYLW